MLQGAIRLVLEWEQYLVSTGIDDCCLLSPRSAGCYQYSTSSSVPFVGGWDPITEDSPNRQSSMNRESNREGGNPKGSL
jgi:hypothetical protein